MIDTHSHIYLEDFDADRDEVIRRAKETGVSEILMPNIDVESIEAVLRVEDDYPGYCYSMMGLHPTSVGKDFEKQLNEVSRQFDKKKFIGIGEIGIDLYWDKTYLEQQLLAFEEQVKWAKKFSLPVVIHSRNSFPEVFSVIDKLWDKDLRGVFHSFTGNEKEIGHILDYGTFYIGLNGVLTFKNSRLREVIKNVPVEKVLLETDAPYLTPVPFRGKRNEPSYVKYVCRQLAEVFGIDELQADAVTTYNARKLFFSSL